MGILNVTPDSFSDGGKFLDLENAKKHAFEMIENGADIIYIGGQSTRPGSLGVSVKEELGRVLPVVKSLRESLPNQIISVDTSKPEVVKAVLDEGVNLINDVTGGGDIRTLELVAVNQAGIILMHMLKDPANMQVGPHYEDVIKEVKNYLRKVAIDAQSQRIAKQSIAIDPGIGFGKLDTHNISILNSMDSFVELGYPVLLGTSRKSILQQICETTETSSLEGATCATTVLGVQAGVKIFRVHDVKANRQAADVAWKLLQGV